MADMNDRRLDVVVLTSGSPLLLPVLEGLCRLPGVRVAGVVFDTERVQAKRTRLEQLRRLLRYEGWRGTAAYVLGRMRGGGRQTHPGPADAGPPLQGGDLQQDPLHGRGARRAGWVRQVAPADSPMDRLREFAARESIRLETVNDVNSAAGQSAVRDIGADLGVVVGTRILKPGVFRIPARGMINVHQAKIPEYRGGGTTFWALYNGEKEVGVTIHEVDEKVDAGRIILQETMPFEYDFAVYGTDFERFVGDVHARLNEMGARLMVRAAELVARGEARPRPMDLTRGRRYRKPTYREKKALRRILRRRYRT